MKIICKKCGKEAEARPVNVRNGRAKYCSKSCSSKSKTGENATHWKGGRYKGSSGHIYLLCPDHPHTNKNRYIQESRLIAEGVIGRYLNKDEVVHHINKITSDNKHGNLVVLTNSEHSKLHGVLKLYNLHRDRYGIKNPFWGRHHSEKSKECMRIAKIGKALSPKHRENMRIARRRFLENASCI